MTEILIVDDEPDIRMLVEAILRDEGFEARSAGTSDDALAAYRARRPHLVILDVWLQGSKLDGIGILDVLHQEEPRVPVVMISGHGTIETAVAAIQRGAYDFIEKPFNSDRLLLVVRRALEAARLSAENAELRLRVGPETTLTGDGQAIASLRAAIERVAPTGSRVLIAGAPGAGKETVARLIHAKSRRAEGPFVALNCAILAPERFETELFGVEATEDRPRRVGVLERAHGGTLLLDEIAEMPVETQSKIARVLQDQSFERVGGGGSRIKVDIRVIASTARDLAEEIAAGRFREDLYYRLAVVPLRVPALRDRREDIPALAAYFLARAAETSGLPARHLASDAIAALQAHDWPGNVRQLRNIMDWLMIMRSGETEIFRAEHLPTELSAHAPRALAIDPAADVMALPLRDARDVFETQYLQAQLLRHGGNISRTANFVGMERSALHRKLKQLGVNSEDRASA
jgi:two-component system nitrogen regulation response regulator NtrX